MQTKHGVRGDLTEANRKRYRVADEKHAQRMRDRGWIVIPPEEASKSAPRAK